MVQSVRTATLFQRIFAVYQTMACHISGDSNMYVILPKNRKQSTQFMFFLAVTLCSLVGGYQTSNHIAATRLF
jgi:hypothetical protein